MKILELLRRRRVVPIVGAYAAGGWIVLEVVDQFADRGVLPDILYPLVLTLFIAGIPGAIIVSWFHGAKGDQKAPRIEVGLLVMVGIVAIVASGIVLRAQLSQAEPIAPLERLAPIEDPRRVAVLYFEGRGTGEEAEHLAVGLTEALIDELSAVEALYVVSRNGVRPFRESAVKPDSIGRALEVGVLVEGRVTQTDTLVRVDIEMIHGKTGAQFERARVERPRAEILALQDDLAQEVSLILREQIGQEISLIERQAGTRNVDAWLRVQEAEELVVQSAQLASLDDLAAAEAHLERADSLLAIAGELEPTWAEPATQRGWVAYQRSRLLGFDRSEANAAFLDAAVMHANRALGRAGRRDSAPALELRATAQYWRHLINLTSEAGETEELFRRAEADFRAAIAKNPRQASALNSLTHLLFRKGQAAEANLTARRAYAADPYLRNASQTVWRIFFASLELQDGVEAQKWCAVGRKRFPDDFRFRECQVWLYALKDAKPDIARAWQLCEEWVELAPAETREFQRGRCHMVVGMALARANLADSARAVVTRARLGPDVDPIRELAQLEAIVRAWIGDRDEAFELLATWIAANPDEGDDGEDEPDTWWFEDLRDDPRYRSIVGG